MKQFVLVLTTREQVVTAEEQLMTTEKQMVEAVLLLPVCCSCLCVLENEVVFSVGARNVKMFTLLVIALKQKS